MTKEDDDLPPGLREVAPIAYSKSPQEKPVETHKATPKSTPTSMPGGGILPPELVSSLRGPEVSEDLQKALDDAKKKVALGDPNGQKELNNVLLQISKTQKPSPMSGKNPSLQPDASLESSNEDPPGLSEVSNVTYKSSAPPKDTSKIAPVTAAEIGLGATVGAVVGRQQRKAEAKKQVEAIQSGSQLPPEMRPMNDSGLQRYVNSQLKASVPVEKLRELTGMDIRTMAEVQKALKVVQGNEPSREPIVRDVNGRKTTVAYRSIPGNPGIDLTPYMSEAPSMLERMGTSAMEAVKSVPQAIGRFLSPIAGGAIAAPQLIQSVNNYMQNKPIDPTQVASGLGGVAMMSRSPLIGTVGAVAQLPYMAKHADEIMNAMSLGEVNPTAFGGMPEGTTTLGQLR